MIRNQKGAALVITLLMVTIFFILGMSIISTALSNTKQVNRTEQEMQAVDLAEMGVIHYHNFFMENLYHILKEPFTDVMNNPDLESINQKMNALVHKIDLSDLEWNEDDSAKLPAIDSKYQYKIQSLNISSNEDKITATIKSSGIIENNSEAVITAIIELDLMKLMNGDTVPDNEVGDDSGNNGEGKVETESPKLLDLKSCIYNSTVGLQNDCFYYFKKKMDFPWIFANFDKVRIDGGSNLNFNSISGNFDNFNINGAKDLTFKILAGNYNNVFINSEQDVYFQSQVSGNFKNSIINVKRDATFSDLVSGNFYNSEINIKRNSTFKTFSGNFEHSIINIKKDVTFNTLSGNIINSSIYIKRDANIKTFSGNILSNSVIYVGKDFYYSDWWGNIDETSKICVGKNIIGGNGNLNNIYSQKADPVKYKQAGCPRVDEDNGDVGNTDETDTYDLNAQQIIDATSLINVNYN